MTEQGTARGQRLGTLGVSLGGCYSGFKLVLGQDGILVRGFFEGHSGFYSGLEALGKLPILGIGFLLFFMPFYA
jgi:hypothetical protein